MTQRNREYWRRAYMRSLSQTRRIAERMLVELEREIIAGPPEKTNAAPPDLFSHAQGKHAPALSMTDANGEWWWGAKEGRLSALTKVSQILLRLIPAERDVRDDEPRTNTDAAITESADSGPVMGALSDTDFALLERFIARRRNTEGRAAAGAEKEDCV